MMQVTANSMEKELIDALQNIANQLTVMNAILANISVSAQLQASCVAVDAGLTKEDIEELAGGDSS